MQRTVREITSSIRIDAPIARVWQAITTPSELKQWFFAVDTESDRKVGSELVHRGEYQGKPRVDKGTIFEFEPPRRLVHTHWSDVSGKPGTPDAYQRVAWDLTELNGGIKLVITERNLPSDEAAATFRSRAGAPRSRASRRTSSSDGPARLNLARPQTPMPP